MGEAKFRRLAEIRTGRGPLISNSPGADFVNRSSGAVYTNHPIGESEWHVITHSSTREKIEQLGEVARILELEQLSVKIDGNTFPIVCRLPDDAPDDHKI